MSVAKLQVRTKLQAGLQICTHSLHRKREYTFYGPNSERNFLKLIFLLLSPCKKKSVFLISFLIFETCHIFKKKKSWLIITVSKLRPQEHDMKERGVWKVVLYNTGQGLCGESATFQRKEYKICGFVVTTNVACLHS